MASAAIRAAVAEAGIEPGLIEQAYGSYIYGDSTCAQHALYDAFMTGIPVINVNNNCSSGSTAIFLARQAVASGAIDCALAFGFEEMQPGALGSAWQDQESPFENFLTVLNDQGYPDALLALRCFGAAGHHYMENTAPTPTCSRKWQSRPATTPRPTLRPVYQRVDGGGVLAAPVLYMGYLTRLMCCPPPAAPAPP